MTRSIPMKETQQSLCDWAHSTFGESPSITRIITRANEEMAELLVAIELAPDAAPEEAADVAIVLTRVAQRLRITLPLDTVTRRAWREPMRVAIDANAALALVLQAESYRSHEIKKHLLRCIRLLAFVCELHGRHLGYEIDRKMARNRRRHWNCDGTGHGYHCGA